MSKKSDFVHDEYYEPHMMRGSFKRNGNVQRTRAIERVYSRVLTELAANRFKWINLPDSVSPRFLEMTLTRSALSVFYFEKSIGKFLSLRGAPTGPLNYNDEPIKFLVQGNSFISRTLSAMDTVAKVGDLQMPVRPQCVPIWANSTRTPDMDIVALFASRFADLERTIEINSHNARRTKVIVTDDNGRLSAVNINREIDSGAPVVQVSAAGMAMLPTALDMGVDPRTLEPLDILRARHWNTCMGLLGINNANQDKKERLVAAEVGANDDQTANSMQAALNARRLGAKLINDRWGLNIEVGISTDIEEQMKSARKMLGMAYTE